MRCLPHTARAAPHPLPPALQAAWPSSAPPAPAYEAERKQGSAHALAQAVLSGLPVHDEAVAVARMAAAAGKSIQEVADWGRNADYTATAYRVAARGRIQAGDGRESGGRSGGRQQGVQRGVAMVVWLRGSLPGLN